MSEYHSSTCANKTRTKDLVIFFLFLALLFSNLHNGSRVISKLDNDNDHNCQRRGFFFSDEYTELVTADVENHCSCNITPSNDVTTGQVMFRSQAGDIATTIVRNVTGITMSVKQQSIPSSFDNKSETTVLYLIFCGGSRGRADLEAILGTWGQKVQRAVVMSNTPGLLPQEWVQDLTRPNHDWKVHYAPSLKGGKFRNSKAFWKETLQLLHDLLEQAPQIQWIVRSDSDTWWNVHYLQQQLIVDNLLPSGEPIMMGQFHPLRDFQWVKGYSHKATNELNTSNGRNAYLAGGAGIVFTRAAITRFYDCCLHNNNLQLNASNLEDVWLSTLAYQ